MKAISYVEKPMNLDELSDAIAKAVLLQEEMKLKKQESEELADRLKKSMDAYKDQLMMDLTKKALAVGIESQKYARRFPGLFGKRTILYVSLKFLGYTNENSEGRDQSQKRLQGSWQLVWKKMPGLHPVLGEKDENLLLVYVGLNEMNGEKSVERQKQIADTLGEILEEDCFTFWQQEA
ncbi:MAG: hypothetical protein ACLTML_09040 [Blautia faecis]